jgi:hypothetical protein
MEMTNWKTLHKTENYGQRNFGIEIKIAMDRDATQNDNIAMYRIADEIEEAIMRETVRLDPEEFKLKEQQKIELLACFGTHANYADEIPNGYCKRWCCSMRPWYTVGTVKGLVTIGWRKRVIQLSWEPRVGASADEEFPGEHEYVTRFDRTIHAWGYEKAKQYIDYLMR